MSIVYRKYFWKIENCAKEIIQRSTKNKSVFKIITIFLNERKTEWTIEFCPNVSGRCEFYIFKNETNDPLDDVMFKSRLYIQKLNETLQFVDEVQAKIVELDANEGFNFSNLFKIHEMFDEANSYIIDESLNFVIEFDIHHLSSEESNEGSTNRNFLTTHEFEKLKSCRDKLLSDFTIVCNDNSIAFNRALLSLKCPIFMETLETDHKAIFNEIDSKSMEIFLRYIYTGVCDLDKNVQNIPHLLYIAEKFHVDDLKSICIGALNRNIGLQNVMDTLKIADFYNEKVLEENCIGFIKMKLDQLKDSDDWSKLSIKHAIKIIYSLDKSPITMFMKSSL